MGSLFAMVQLEIEYAACPSFLGTFRHELAGF